MSSTGCCLWVLPSYTRSLTAFSAAVTYPKRPPSQKETVRNTQHRNAHHKTPGVRVRSVLNNVPCSLGRLQEGYVHRFTPSAAAL